MTTPRVQRTILDSAPELSNAERVDAFLEGLKEKRRRLRAELVDETAADETLRRELLEVLKILGQHKRGRVASSARIALVKALQAAGCSKDEIAQQIEDQFGASERQVALDRDLKDNEARKAPAKRR